MPKVRSFEELYDRRDDAHPWWMFWARIQLAFEWRRPRLFFKAFYRLARAGWRKI